MIPIFQDLRYALRSLRQSPGFTALAVATLAVGIGATTAIFSIVHAALLRGLPYREPARLVHLWETSTRGEFARREASYPDYVALRDGATAVFEQVAGYSEDGVTLAGREHGERVGAARVTANFFSTLGVSPVLGRSFEPGEDDSGAAPVAVVSRALWSRLFGPDTALTAAATITLDEVPHTVVGVLPADFEFAPAETPDVWLPVRPSERQKTRGYMHWFRLIGRLKPGVTLARATADADAVAVRREADDPRFHGAVRMRITRLSDEVVGDVRPILAALAAAVSCVFLIVCANVANLMVGRSSRRRKEIGIRIALGATRGQITRLLLAESFLLSALGAGAGLAVAQAVLRLLLAGVPPDGRARMPFLERLTLDAPILAFAAAIAVVAAAVFGLVPALRIAGAGAFASMKGEAASAAPLGRRRGTSALVAAQVALTLVVLTAAGLLVRSTLRLLGTDPGYRAGGILTTRVWLPPSRYPDASAVPAAEKKVLAELAAIPGVEAAASTSRLPLGGGDTGTPVFQGRPLIAEAHIRTVSDGYFGAMGLALRRGRGFSNADTLGKPRVAIVNESFARRAFPGEDAIGRQVGFVFIGDETLTIVGVVADENVTGPEAAVTPVLYFSSAQDPSPSFFVVLRSAGDSEALGAAVVGRLAALDREIVAGPMWSLARRLHDFPSVFLRRYPAGLIGGFGLVGLGLAAIGVFGVAAREVTRRRREIGIRMALGAEPADVVRLFLAESARPVATGLAAGALGSLVAVRLLSGLLFGVSPFDAPTWIAVAVLLSGVAALASAVPAFAAARIDPASSLRGE
jgi:putative ABC transport system permease protein